MKAIQSLFSSNQLALRLQPTLIADGQLLNLLCEMQLQLLATLHQRSAELQEMLLDQTGRRSHGHAAGQARTVRILAQGQAFGLVLAGGAQC